MGPGDGLHTWTTNGVNSMRTEFREDGNIAVAYQHERVTALVDGRRVMLCAATWRHQLDPLAWVARELDLPEGHRMVEWCDLALWSMPKPKGTSPALPYKRWDR